MASSLETERKSDVVVIGSCFMDMLWYVPRVPKSGETLHATKFQLDFGGKAANQAVMAAKLGARVSMVAMLGKDKFGFDTLENFKKYNVNTDFIQMEEGGTTGVTTISVDNDGQPAFIGLAGSNKSLTMEHIKLAEDLIKSTPVVICDKGIPLKISLSALKFAKDLGCRTLFNPSPTIEHLNPVEYTYISVLLINAIEGEGLTGIPVDGVETAKEVVKEIHQRGSENVVLTLGKDGAVCLEKIQGQEYDISYVTTSQVETVDTTGAGDSVVGALAYFLACHPSLPFKEAVRRSIAIATITVTSHGVQSSYPARQELPSYLFDDI
ncbi:ribokinase isoform X2 [Exaiptasia diaphana]|uniref:Ribokinase n=1 Tax=Exaiptasia diaphana TaxID=2652724 RepID=A0A913XEV7_EXADI|nr:ribokinase isoform X2 [Exaiptasia diaphana]